MDPFQLPHLLDFFIQPHTSINFSICGKGVVPLGAATLVVLVEGGGGVEEEVKMKKLKKKEKC
jgi:hypothetical protein